MNPLPCILTVQGSGFFVGNCYFDYLKGGILRKKATFAHIFHLFIRGKLGALAK